ncbi:MAG: hypothetical protein ABI266_08175 [Ginsengibacter sp.]
MVSNLAGMIRVDLITTISLGNFSKSTGKELMQSEQLITINKMGTAKTK